MVDWSEPFTASYRFMRVNSKTMKEVSRIDNIEESGSITRNSDTSIKESGSLTAHGVFDIGTDYLRVYFDAVGMYTGWSASIALGTFMPTVSSRDVDGVHSTSEISLSGLLKLADDDDFNEPVTLPAGSNPVACAKSMLEGVGLSVVADASNYRLSSTWTFGVDNDEAGKLSAVNALLDIAGFSSAITDEMGKVHLNRYIDPSERTPSHSFVEGHNARFLAKVTDEFDTSEVKNVMRAIYSSQDTTVIGVAEDNDPDSKWSTVSLGRRIVGTERYQDVVTQAQANTKARELLANSQSVIRRVTISHVYVPGIAVGDAVSIEFPSGGVSGNFVSRVQDIDLGAGCIVKNEVKRTERA